MFGTNILVIKMYENKNTIRHNDNLPRFLTLRDAAKIIPGTYYVGITPTWIERIIEEEKNPFYKFHMTKY